MLSPEDILSLEAGRPGRREPRAAWLLGPRLIGTIPLEVSCQIEIEFDETRSDDADDIQRRVEKAYAARGRAVEMS